MFLLKRLEKNQYLISFISGLALNIAFFVPSIYANFIALFCISPLFIALTQTTTFKKRYRVGVVFFGAWLIPTTYWYYLIFPWWQAFLQSVGFVFLMAWILVIIGMLIDKTKNIFAGLMLGSLIWSIFEGARLIAPVTKEWWIPHLGYTQWLNPIFLQITAIVGVGGVIFLVLFSNIILTKFLLQKRYITGLSFCFLLILFCLSVNFILKTDYKSDGIPFTLIGIQGSPQDGYYADATHDDVLVLSERTARVIEKIKRTDTPIMVVWPENMIKAEEDDYIKNFTQKKNIYLVYDRAEPNESPYPWNTAVIVDNNGKFILTNYKKHAAPGEAISVSEKFGFVLIGGKKITADICYDLHYADIGSRINGTDLLLAPVDDDRFGRFFPQLHAADTVFRAIENRVNIITASTNAPTFFVNRYGVIEKMPLPAYIEDEIIVNTKI